MTLISMYNSKVPYFNLFRTALYWTDLYFLVFFLKVYTLVDMKLVALILFVIIKLLELIYVIKLLQWDIFHYILRDVISIRW